MPNCFTLTRKSDTEAGPVAFSTIDDEMCEHFGVKPDPKMYHRGWYDCIGLALACGQTWDKIRETFSGMVPIVDWLESHFIPNAWAEIGRR